MFLALDLLITLAVSSAVSADDARAQDCSIHLKENENLVTLQGAVDPQIWTAGTYTLLVETRQNGNVSLSQQAGAFEGGTHQTQEILVLSTTTIYLSRGSQLNARLKINDGKQRSSCSLSYRK
ncbi:curli-like amyloid fiber formation chaperone CsgH [Thalassobius sp. Cn5-15]|jgi:hypothetical protein|uniref:curli-like amyloid fiber formation chaperone CsgH n=1 Tax=Thalassobius sp. Cn5-15 TaxID=2917763 RepID=UPI001EF21B60|nr:curli-like amyloid fiber formation chaperone CsgH [Thalassobius sp. Cn5-15]MCG7493169.1 hypothetical protein [Thalassobius sp. Cn5-15]